MHGPKHYSWYKISENLDSLEFPASGITEIQVKNKIICLAKTPEGLRACTDKCPHAGGTLSKGYLDAMGNIHCHLHHYKFSLFNGRNLSGEGYFLKTYPVEMRADGIYLGIEDLL
jgi:3-phenylpropionate/trans-cinnamate dioxygenase ferredoxin subunit